jgi:hypothetical protein
MKLERCSAVFLFAMCIRRFAAYTIGFSLVAIGTGVVQGDAIVITKAMSATTIAEVFVEDESIRLDFEIGANDIEAFKNLLPDEIYDRFAIPHPEPQEKRIERFFAEELVIQADSKPLVGKVLQLTARQRIVRDEVTGKPLAVQPDDGELVVYAKLEYKLDGKPQTITIQPVMDPEQIRATANIGFITYHRGLPVMDFRYLSSPETLELDWEDPWYSKFQNRNLRRQFDAPLSVYLYVEPFEVRVEVVVRPVDLQRWIDLGVQTDQMIPISGQGPLKSKVAAFFRDRLNVTIDGEHGIGQLDRIHFISRTLRKTGVVYPDQELDASSATLGVIFVFPIQRLPDWVKLEWKLFDERIRSVPSVATDEAGGLPWTLTVEDPVLEWKNFLTNPTIPAMLAIEPPPTRPQVSIPWASAALLFVSLMTAVRWLKAKSPGQNAVSMAVLMLSIGGAFWLWPTARIELAHPLVAQRKVSDEQADEVTCSLLHNLYHSFDRREESVVYDRLATCVSGDLLRDIYLQFMQRITLEKQGGAQVKIDNIDVLETDFVYREDSPGFKCNVKWNVSGTVGHWGHVHTRANQYVAEFSVEPVDGAWKIVSMQITDEADLGPPPVN